eukprot:TRINITY_DN76864_c0_g1_i1.p1 TRINITY_DN76864_c0_g1~~TRINITY_DN76864_c0_g1_i1.p1  ORF type:complete len:459 (-),score=56.92 TRINITY_DN76864_c0_g1_i1:145-1521(-)
MDQAISCATVLLLLFQLHRPCTGLSTTLFTKHDKTPFSSGAIISPPHLRDISKFEFGLASSTGDATGLTSAGSTKWSWTNLMKGAKAVIYGSRTLDAMPVGQVNIVVGKWMPSSTNTATGICEIGGFMSNSTASAPQWTVTVHNCSPSSARGYPFTMISDDCSTAGLLVVVGGQTQLHVINAQTGNVSWVYLVPKMYNAANPQSISCSRHGMHFAIVDNSTVIVVNTMMKAIQWRPLEMHRIGPAHICPMGEFLVWAGNNEAKIHWWFPRAKRFIPRFTVKAPTAGNAPWTGTVAATSVNGGGMVRYGCLWTFGWTNGTHAAVQVGSLLSGKTFLEQVFAAQTVTAVEMHMGYATAGFSGGSAASTLMHISSQTPLHTWTGASMYTQGVVLEMNKSAAMPNVNDPTVVHHDTTVVFGAGSVQGKGGESQGIAQAEKVTYTWDHNSLPPNPGYKPPGAN